MKSATIQPDLGGKATAADVRAITPHLAAEVRGLRLSAEPDAQTLALIRDALAKHLVLVFKDQSLSAAELRDFTAHFGPLFIHHDDDGVLRADGLPEVLEMRKEPEGTRLFGGSDWHADVTFRKPAGYLSILHALILPPLGGDTGFANTIAAFGALSEGLQSVLRGLQAVHSYHGPGRPDCPGQTAIHPLVRRHPETGAEGLYINRMFVTRLQGMTAEESRPLIDFLDRHITRPEFTCRISWEKGQVVMWDNRFTLHYPINDFTGHRRLLIRSTAMEG
ncbi:MAG: TauD/TfdA family dioxygenase [Kiloniellales bacterium]|nr:TauD/TfdA family dioxygenase [Kiloniellales bacterium]